MKILYKIYEFLFDPWKKIILEEGSESWSKYTETGFKLYSTERDFVKYKYIHKFSGSEKIVKKYLN